MSNDLFMKNITNLIITIILKLISYISLVLNRKSRLLFGKIIGNSLAILSRKRYNITLNNIRCSLDVNENEVKAIAKKSYQNLGITLSELLVLDKISEKELHEYINYSNIELIEEAYNEGNGVILLSGHYGNWEYLAYTAGLFTKLPLTVIVKPQSNKLADQYLNKTRISGGNKVISMYKAARAIVSELNHGNVIALLADQNAGRNNDVYANFFGKSAATYSAPAVLALKFKSPIIMGFAVRDTEGIYNVDLVRINPSDYPNDSHGVQLLTQKHVDILEEQIRKKPNLWAWQHRRWK